MNKLLIDTNIILDLLAKRYPFYDFAAELFSLADSNKVELYTSSISIINTNYILSKILSEKEVREILRKFRILVEVLPCDGKIIDLGLNSSFKDYEDAVQYFTAIESQMDIIITRNLKDFKNSKIPVLTAEEFLKSNS